MVRLFFFNYYILLNIFLPLKLVEACITFVVFLKGISNLFFNILKYCQCVYNKFGLGIVTEIGSHRRMDKLINDVGIPSISTDFQ